MKCRRRCEWRDDVLLWEGGGVLVLVRGGGVRRVPVLGCVMPFWPSDSYCFFIVYQNMFISPLRSVISQVISVFSCDISLDETPEDPELCRWVYILYRRTVQRYEQR